jgi:toxin HigB-1
MVRIPRAGASCRSRGVALVWLVIVGYRDKRTRDFAAGKRVKAFSGFERAAHLKLDRLEAATALGDLAGLPGNRLESLAGDRRGQHSLRINDQWRICFEWRRGASGPSNVEIVDYH